MVRWCNSRRVCESAVGAVLMCDLIEKEDSALVPLHVTGGALQRDRLKLGVR